MIHPLKIDDPANQYCSEYSDHHRKEPMINQATSSSKWWFWIINNKSSGEYLDNQTDNRWCSSLLTQVHHCDDPVNQNENRWFVSVTISWSTHITGKIHCASAWSFEYSSWWSTWSIRRSLLLQFDRSLLFTVSIRLLASPPQNNRSKIAIILNSPSESYSGKFTSILLPREQILRYRKSCTVMNQKSKYRGIMDNGTWWRFSSEEDT